MYIYIYTMCVYMYTLYTIYAPGARRSARQRSRSSGAAAAPRACVCVIIYCYIALVQRLRHEPVLCVTVI